MKSRIHRTALIGSPPEMQDWKEGDAMHYPHISADVRINAFCTVDSGVDKPTFIGEDAYLLAHVHVGHDASIGHNVTLATGVIIGGYAEVGTGSKLGLGAVVLPYRKIGKNCTIGAGSVVTKNVPDGETWLGNPAKPIKKRDLRPFSDRETDSIDVNSIRDTDLVFLEVLHQQVAK